MFQFISVCFRHCVKASVIPCAKYSVNLAKKKRDLTGEVVKYGIPLMNVKLTVLRNGKMAYKGKRASKLGVSLQVPRFSIKGVFSLSLSLRAYVRTYVSMQTVSR